MEYTAEDFISFIETGRRDKISPSALDLIAKRFRELESNQSIGKCVEKNCTKNATKDYNGHKHFVCDDCYDSLTRYFEEEYD